MKPIYIEVQAFGPFKDKQRVDFEKLSKNGIFLIKGETGSGKTTIFDAILFALYGACSSGNKEREKIENWRCNQADEGTDTYTEFVFSERGKKYYFKRTLKKNRNNRFTDEYDAGEMDEDGNRTPFSNKIETRLMTSKAESIIGLNADQFRQVVLLPQGKFEQFITSKTEEKQKLLAKLFSCEKWDEYARCFKERADKRKNELYEEKHEVDVTLAPLAITSPDELENMLASKKQEQEALQKQYRQDDCESKQKELNEAFGLLTQFEQLSKCTAKAETYDKQEAEINLKKQKCTQAEQAEELRQIINDSENAKKQYDDAVKQITELQSGISEQKKKCSDAKNAFEKHNAESNTAELNAKIGELEGKRQFYQEIDTKEKNLAKAKKEYEDAKAQSEEAESEYDSAVNKAALSKSEFDKESNLLKSFRDRYYAGIYGNIASELTDNMPCPICGSLEHPNPASKIPNSVTKDELEKQEEKADSQEKQWKDDEQTRKDAELKKNTVNQTLNEKETALASARTSLKEAQNSLVQGINSETELDAEITKIQNRINAYNTEHERLNSAYQAAQSELSILSGKIENAKKTKEELESQKIIKETELNEALTSKCYSCAEDVKKLLLDNKTRSELTREVAAFESVRKENSDNLAKISTELRGKTEPDKNDLEQRQSALNDLKTAYDQESQKLKDAINSLETVQKIVVPKMKDFEEHITEAENDSKIGDMLCGTRGLGLQRYVIAILFEQIIAEANRMLEGVHGGRYRLYRSDEKGTGKQKSGLEIFAYDNRSRSGEGRHVSTMSGGEKFLVSLALSIGMSTVAQRTGVSIDSVFIDEGFGTLDDKSIDDAMSVLDSVKNNSGTIGIISHVKLLEENIPTQIEAVKDINGNYLKYV